MRNTNPTSLAVPPLFTELMLDSWMSWLCPLDCVYYAAAANSFQYDKTKAAIIALIVNKFAKTSKPKLHYDDAYCGLIVNVFRILDGAHIPSGGQTSAQAQIANEVRKQQYPRKTIQEVL